MSEHKQLGLYQESVAVFRAREKTFKLNSNHIELLIKQARLSSTGRARICLHSRDSDTLHEMLIAFSSKSYVCPHMHPNKAESFQHILGSFKVILFDNSGMPIERHTLDENNPFFRINSGIIHTLIPLEDGSIIHEVTTGPFVKSETIDASFALQHQNLNEQLNYQKRLLVE